MKVTKSDVYRSLSNPEYPIHVLFDRAKPRKKGWPDAALHALKTGDRLINLAMRPATLVLGPVVVTRKALALPGWKKAAVLPAPLVGLVGGACLGVASGLFDISHVVLHGGGSLGNVLYAVGHDGFAALYDDVLGVWRGADAYAQGARPQRAPAAVHDDAPAGATQIQNEAGEAV